MSVGYYRGLCQEYRGRAVNIRTNDGRAHRGIIEHVDGTHVMIRPFGRERLGGFGYGFGGFGGYGAYGGYNRGYRIALGAIAAIALIPLIFW